jgi:predicted branched-subunit amino acid permease
MDERQKARHGRKASVLVVVGVAWVALAALFLLSSAGFSVPGWIPLSLVIPTLVAFEVS